MSNTNKKRESGKLKIQHWWLRRRSRPSFLKSLQSPLEDNLQRTMEIESETLVLLLWARLFESELALTQS